MAFLTDRKRAQGLGSAKEGTHHFWSMTVSSVALAILIPVFVFTLGPMIGQPHADVVAYLSRPFPAIVAGLTIVVGMLHFKSGAAVMIEDYSRGLTRKVLIVGVTLLSYAVAATGLFALARLAL